MRKWIEKGMPKVICKRRASPPHPKTLAISVKTIFVQVVGFCVWPIHCATLASPWRSFRWNALFCWVPCFFLLPLGSFSQVGAACVLQSTFFLQRSRTESGRKNIPKTLKYNRKWVPKSMPGRPKIDKISSLRFRSVFGGSRGGKRRKGCIFRVPVWEPFSARSRKKVYPEINAKIVTEKVSENVAIEAKRGPKMRPKWVRKSRIFWKGPRWVVLRKSSFYCNKTMVWVDSGLQESV